MRKVQRKEDLLTPKRRFWSVVKIGILPVKCTVFYILSSHTLLLWSGWSWIIAHHSENILAATGWYKVSCRKLTSAGEQIAALNKTLHHWSTWCCHRNVYHGQNRTDGMKRGWPQFKMSASADLMQTQVLIFQLCASVFTLWDMRWYEMCRVHSHQPSGSQIGVTYSLCNFHLKAELK